MIETRTEVRIDAPPEVVFPWLTQGEYLVQWQGLLTSATRRDEDRGEVGLGSAFRLVLDFTEQFPQVKPLLGTAEIVIEGSVTEYDLDEHLRIKGDADLLQIDITYWCEAVGEGQTHVIQVSRLEFRNFLLRQASPLAQGVLQQVNEQDLQRLKAAIEAQHAG